MPLQTAFIAPSGYLTTSTTMRNLVERVFPFGTGFLKTFTLTPVPGLLQLTVSAFAADIVGAAASQGAYFVWNDATEVVSFPTAAAQARYDTLLLLVADAEYGSVVAQGPKWKVVSGTPAGSPSKLTDPAVAALVTEAGAYVRVADVLIPGSATSINAGDISKTWKDISGGPAARLTRGTNQSIPDTTVTPVSFTTHDWDTHNGGTLQGHNDGSNPSRWYAPIDGLYQVSASIPFAANAAGVRELNFKVNNTTTYAGSRGVPTASVSFVLNAAQTIMMTAGQYVEAVVYQSVGSALNVDASYASGPFMTISYLRGIPG